MKRIFDCVFKFHDKEFDGPAEFKFESCKTSQFTEQFEQQLDEIEENMGKVKSITFIFK